MSIILMLNYARSGGTLLNKCLASLPNVIMLSEVNPIGGGSGADEDNPTNSIKSQLKNWYNINISEGTFKSQVAEIYNYCQQNNKTLIIRDWSFVNFSNFEKYNNNNPSNKFLILEELKEFDLKIFGFVRDSVDVWLSRGCPDIETFYNEYISYIDCLLNIGCPIFKYEDFVRSPRKELKAICQSVGLKYTDVFDFCLNYEKINGDIQNKEKSRGIKQGEIKQLPRKIVVSEKIAEINTCKKMRIVNSKLYYPKSFYNSFWKDYILVPAKNVVKKIIK